MIQVFKSGFRPSFPLKYLFITCLYFALSLFGILHHEMWLDEMHHFLLAKDSNSLYELYYNARYDGHPLLWNILLMVITRFSNDPFYMQLVHIIISTITVIIFLRNAPFADTFKMLFVFGYFMLYEYNIISRNYALSVLFLISSVTLICAGKKNYLLILLSLLVLSYTHLFSLFCAVALFAVMIHEYYSDHKEKISKTQFNIMCSLFIIAICIIFYSIIPPTDHFLKQYDHDPYLAFKRIGKAFSIFFKGLFHFPNMLEYHFWNTNLLVDISKNLSIIPSVFCFIIPFLLFYNKPFSLFVFYSATISIAMFIFWSPIIAGVRYFGFILMLFIVSLWLAEIKTRQHFILPQKFSDRIHNFNLRFKSPFIFSILIIQFVSSVFAFTSDISKPFSEGKEVADFINKNNQAAKTIVVSNQCSGPPISGYLNKKLFYPETNDFGSFCKWNTNPFMISKDTLISRIGNIKDSDFILVMNDTTINSSQGKLENLVFSDDKIKIFYLATFDRGILRTENYRMYKVKRIHE